MKLSLLLIAPISFPSGPFYRLVTITLYISCHRFFTLCEASQGYSGNPTGPILTHFTDLHFTLCHPTCLLLWHTNLRVRLLLSAEVLPTSASGVSLRLPSVSLRRLTSSRLFRGLHCAQYFNLFAGHFRRKPRASSPG
jgi:hypothetical protein